jgi:acetoin utilization protein AcuB
MRLSEIMSTEVQTTSRRDDAEAAYDQMRTHRIRHLVVREGKRIVGVLSDRDLGGPRGRVMRYGKRVEDLMSPQTTTATPGTTVRQAANLMRSQRIGCLPLLADGKLVGIVTITDLLDLLGRQPSAGQSVKGRKPQGTKWKRIHRMSRPERQLHTRP